MADGPKNKTDRTSFSIVCHMYDSKESNTPFNFKDDNRVFIHTYLLPSSSNAIAMRSLILRNITIMKRMTSITESEITTKQIC